MYFVRKNEKKRKVAFDSFMGKFQIASHSAVTTPTLHTHTTQRDDVILVRQSIIYFLPA
jgi:hypothetical protein